MATSPDEAEECPIHDIEKQRSEENTEGMPLDAKVENPDNVQDLRGNPDEDPKAGTPGANSSGHIVRPPDKPNEQAEPGGQKAETISQTTECSLRAN